MHEHAESFLVLVLHQVPDPAFDLIEDEYAGLDLSRAVAGGANLCGDDTHFGAHPLSCDLGHAELGKGEDGMFCAVFLHGGLQRIEHMALILGVLHVDKIDDDNAAEVAEAQLACDLPRRFQVYGHGICLLVALDGGFVSRVDIDDVECFCMLNDEIGPAVHVHGPSEEGLDLPGYAVYIEDGFVAVMEVDDLFMTGGNAPDIVLHLVHHARLIHHHIIKGMVEHIAKQGIGFPGFAEDDLRGMHAFQPQCDLLPLFHEAHHVVVELLHRLPFGDGTHDHTKVLRAHLVDDFLQPFSFLGGVYFPGNAHHLIERCHHEEASGQGNFAAKPRAFGLNGLLDDLHEDVLVFRKDVVDLAGLDDLGFLVKILHADRMAFDGCPRIFIDRPEKRIQVGIVQEGVAFEAHVHEAGIQAGADLFDTPQV